jgi:aryl-alcohol dehydrogenase-like predicted oxidoreductase
MTSGLETANPEMGSLGLRPLGQTGLRVSHLGLGLAALGRPGYINLGHSDDLEGSYQVDQMQARAHDVLDAAYRAGVRYFDAARSYGRAEEFLGSWLEASGLRAEQVVVGSKWGYTYTAGWSVDATVHEIKEHTLAVLRRQWGESRKHLGAFLDLYQIHSATLDSGVLENWEVLAELSRLKERGVAIGLSVSGPGQSQTIERALEVQVDGARVFDSVQATWNLLERSTGAVLARAREGGMGVVVKEALANGRLTDRNQASDFQAQRQALAREARRLGTTLDALALAAVLAQPWADVVLSGAARLEHLQSNLNAASVAWDAAAAEALSGLAEPAETYWEIRSALPWN